MSTYSHIASPCDNRCTWIQRIADPVVIVTIDPANVSGARDLPGAGQRKKADSELAAWTVVFDVEAIHHTKQRGWRHTVGIVAPTGEDGDLGLQFFSVGAAHKARIKAAGRSDLMGGSGPNAAMVRVARYILDGGDAGRCARLAEMRAIGA